MKMFYGIISIKFAFIQFPIMTFEKFIDDHKPDIMTGLPILPAWISQSNNTFHFILPLSYKYNKPSPKELAFCKGGLILSFYLFYSSSSSSSSSAPTSSGSADSSSSDGSKSSSSVGAVTVATAVSSSSRISYLSDFGKSAMVILSPISKSDTSTTISSGMLLGFARTTSSNNGCCNTPPSFVPAASPSRRIATSTSISSDISTI